MADLDERRDRTVWVPNVHFTRMPRFDLTLVDPTGRVDDVVPLQKLPMGRPWPYHWVERERRLVLVPGRAPGEITEEKHRYDQIHDEMERLISD